MPNSRRSNKRHCGAWLTPEEIAALKIIAAGAGTDLSGLLRGIANGDIVVPANPAGNNNKEVDND